MAKVREDESHQKKLCCRKHYACSVPAKDTSVQWHLATFQLLFPSKSCTREEAEGGNNLTSIFLEQYLPFFLFSSFFFLFVSFFCVCVWGGCLFLLFVFGFFLSLCWIEKKERNTLWSSMEWVSWGQCAQAYLLFPMLLFSCIACSAIIFSCMETDCILLL